MTQAKEPISKKFWLRSMFLLECRLFIKLLASLKNIVSIVELLTLFLMILGSVARVKNPSLPKKNWKKLHKTCKSIMEPCLLKND